MNEQSNTQNIMGDGGFNLGSIEMPQGFDPFALPTAPPETPPTAAPVAQFPQPAAAVVQQPTPGTDSAPETEKPEPPPADNPLAMAMDAAETKDAGSTVNNLIARPPKFVFAGASEDITDTSQTFEDLRIAKEADFPELAEGKRVSWTVTYGKITKTVADPKGSTIGKMKSDIETSKEFIDSLKKLKVDQRDSVICEVKPRITAQSKGRRQVAAANVRFGGDDGVFPSYKALFTTLADAEASDKVISIIPARDGNVYERRKNEIGTFITRAGRVPELSEVTAGFIPALPRIPMDVLQRIIAFFRSFMRDGVEYEALAHVLWCKTLKMYTISVPEQSVTKTSVNIKMEQDYDPEHFIHVMDVHSHNSMAARFSKTDDADERATRLYAVIGRLDRFLPQICVRFSNGGKYHYINPAEIFEEPDGQIPLAWHENVKTDKGG